MQKLKPCPFCGSENIKIHEARGYWNRYVPRCDECMFEFDGFKDTQEAINKWNTRVCESVSKQDANAFMSAMEGMYNVTFVDAKKGK